MTIHWPKYQEYDQFHLTELIETEYALRRKLMKLIIQDEALEKSDPSWYKISFSLETQKLTVDETTPEPFRTRLQFLIDTKL